MRVVGFTLVLGLGVMSVAGIARADSGPYTDKQAEAGHVLFNNNCAQCHGPKLDGALGPNLHDAKFQAMFADKPVKNLRDFVYENMPQNAPKSLSDANLYPILAWILKKNNVPAGDKELTKASADRRQVPQDRKVVSTQSLSRGHEA